MAISKIILNGVTQMDLTQDTTNASRTLSPYTGHGADGEAFTGGYVEKTFTTKSITENGTYSASSDNADGYSSVTVNVPTGITPTGTKTIAIAENGTTTEDVTQYASAQITVNVPSSGSAKNVQVAAGVNRVATTDYTTVSGQSITVAETGIYDVYWTGFRSSTSGTNGSQLYINDTAYGSAQTTFSNHAQAIHLTGVSLTQGQTVTVRARARGTNYYMYAGDLTIVQTA